MKIALLIGLLSYSLHAGSQTLITPATLNMGGGTAAITQDFIVDWSIGESTITETFYGTNSFSNSVVGIYWNVTSGILQPYDKNHIIYNFLIPTWTSQEIHFYPIPTPDIVSIDFRSAATGKMSIHLYNQDGKLIGSREFFQVNGNSKQTWDLSNRASGIYYFRIQLSSDQGVILKQGTFKVEKNK